MKFFKKNTYYLSHLFLRSIQNSISLHEEIYMKYYLSEMYPISNREMYYKKSERFFKEISRHIFVYFLFSLSFEERINQKDFFLFISLKMNIFKENLQNMILRLGELGSINSVKIVRELLHKKETDSQFVDRLYRRNILQRRESDTLNLHNTVNANERYQRLKPTTGHTVPDVGTRSTTSVPVRGLPQSWQTISIAQEPSITPVVYAQSSILQEMVFKSHDNVFISARTLLDQRWQTKMLTTATILTTISERQVGTPTMSIPQSVYLTRDTQLTLREWPAPSIKQTLVETTMGTTTHFHTASITNATHPFTVICRAGHMEPPHLSYAFAQPRRPMAQDEHAVVKVHEKEVVKVVQKEVQSLMSSGSLVKYLSRADYTHIADNVYSSLARRLLVERERLGIR